MPMVFFANYFVGYNSNFGVDYTPVRGYTFSDDLTQTGKQINFETQAPNSRIFYNRDRVPGWRRTMARRGILHGCGSPIC